MVENRFLTILTSVISYSTHTGSLFDQAPGQEVKNLNSKVDDFFKILILGDFKHVNGTPESGSVSLRRPKFWSWKAFFGSAVRRHAYTELFILNSKFKV
jgi:hypothetical protein